MKLSLKWLSRHVPPERVVMSVDSLVGMVHAVEQGVGAAMLLCPLADARPALVRLAEPQPALNTSMLLFFAMIHLLTMKPIVLSCSKRTLDRIAEHAAASCSRAKRPPADRCRPT